MKQTTPLSVHAEVGSVAKPEVGKNFPALMGFVGPRKRDAATIAGQGQTTVGQFSNFDLSRVLLSRVHVANRQRMDNRRTHGHLNIRGHLPEVAALEESR